MPDTPCLVYLHAMKLFIIHKVSVPQNFRDIFYDLVWENFILLLYTIFIFVVISYDVLQMSLQEPALHVT
jgi:hypothetical protein